MKISVQLYSLRDAIASDGPESVLKKVKAAGFDGAELAGTYGFTPAQLRRKFDDAGLAASGAHVPFDQLENDFGSVRELCGAFGLKNVVVPWLPPECFAEEFGAFAAKMTALQENCAQAGLTLIYHNHAHEFAGGRDGLAALCDAVPGLKLEVDTFWLAAAGYKVTDYLAQKADKIALLHIKELSAGGAAAENPVVGQGVTDCAGALRFAKARGHEWAVLETERTGLPVFEYLKKSADFMKQTVL